MFNLSSDRKAGALWLKVLWSLALSGCVPSARVTLDQPFAPSSQRHLELRGGPASAADNVGRCSYLLGFRRPGQSDGPFDFLIYISAPAGTGAFEVDSDRPEGVRGFLIQEVGLLRGKTPFSGGRICVRPLWLLPGRQELELSLQCADGTVVTGRAIAERSAGPVRLFERKKAADVMLLTSSPEPAGDSAEPTPRRGLSEVP